MTFIEPYFSQSVLWLLCCTVPIDVQEKETELWVRLSILMLLFNPDEPHRDVVIYMDDSQFFLRFTLSHSKEEEKHEQKM